MTYDNEFFIPAMIFVISFAVFVLFFGVRTIYLHTAMKRKMRLLEAQVKSMHMIYEENRKGLGI